MSLETKEIAGKSGGWSRVVRAGLTSKANVKRDSLVIGLLLVALGVFTLSMRPQLFSGGHLGEIVGETDKNLSEEQIYQEVKAVQETVSITNWKTHQSRWYGIEVKYPENWSAPQAEAPSRGVNWEYRYAFRKNVTEQDSPYIGFDVVIYNVAKVKELSNTAEFPLVKDEALKNAGMCDTIPGHLIETGDYPAEEIYIPPSDDCYRTTLFFSFTRGQYIYNLVPQTRTNIEMRGDPRIELIDNFPEFFSVASTLEIIDTVRVNRPSIMPRPRITSPKPLTFKIDSAGRMVCGKKNDHPRKSIQHKGRHLDMECCLDPDEYPNPWCDYSSKIYSRYLP